MNSPSDNLKSTSSPASPLPSADLSFQLRSEPMVEPMTDAECIANWQHINKLHPANRFRLMFWQPLLLED